MKVEHTFSVRYEETDRMGVAYYANYLVWFELGRTAFFKKLGIPYREMEDVYQCILPVVEAFCRYIKSVEYDDQLNIITTITGVKRRGLTFHYLIEREGLVVAEGFTKHVVVDKRGKVRSFPEKIYMILKKVEYGDSETRRGG